MEDVKRLAGIFYISTNRPAMMGTMIETSPSRRRVFVRCEEVRVDGLEEALDMARPEPGESVMNTHWLES